MMYICDSFIMEKHVCSHGMLSAHSLKSPGVKEGEGLISHVTLEGVKGRGVG